MKGRIAMKLRLTQFFAQTSRNHVSVMRETHLSRQRLEQWIAKDAPIFVHFDPINEVVHRITEEPEARTLYFRQDRRDHEAQNST